MRQPVALVVAKAPVPGEAKTRLGAVVGSEQAADLAAAALLDTLGVCAATYGVECCHLALAGDLAAGARADELVEASRGWAVHPQRGDTFAQRLVRAHIDVAATGVGPVIQVGMDTPQLEPRHLRDAEEMLTGRDDAVLGPAYDGGWWLLGVNSTHVLEHLADVPMSTSETGLLTRAALERAGARVTLIESLADVDEAEDAAAVAAAAPNTRFARAWRASSSAR